MQQTCGECSKRVVSAQTRGEYSKLVVSAANVWLVQQTCGECSKRVKGEELLSYINSVLTVVITKPVAKMRLQERSSELKSTRYFRRRRMRTNNVTLSVRTL